MFGARYLDFNKDSKICLNPFTKISLEDFDEEIGVIAALVMQMIYSATDSIPEETAETEISLIKAAIRGVYRDYGNEASIDNVYEYLLNFPNRTAEEDLESEDVSADVFMGISKRLAFNRVRGKYEDQPLIPFTEDFVEFLYETSAGKPGEIIIRCDHVLDVGVEKEITLLTDSFAKEVFDLRGILY